MNYRLASALLCSLLATHSPADWPQFRGANSAGIANDGATPVEFGPGKNELWSVSLDSGHSSPCIVGDAIFLTTYRPDERELAIVCLARETGAIRWRHAVPTTSIEKGHPSFSPASSTPTCDGELVIGYFGSFGLSCLDIHGQRQWQIEMPLTKSYAGNATSPAIVGDRVILYRGNHVDHFLLAVDKRTGKQLWKVTQDEPFVSELACTACPIVAGDNVIVHSARSVQAYELATGNLVWVAKCATTATSTPVLAGDEVVVAAWNKMGEPALRPAFPSFSELTAVHDEDGNGLINKDELPRLMIFHRPDGAEAPENGGALRFRDTDANRDGQIDASEWNDRVSRLEEFRAGYDEHGMLAIRVDSQGSVLPAQIRTLEQHGIPEVPSPLHHAGLIYFVKNGGVITCLESKTGERVYRTRTKGRGTHYASPIISDGKLYSTAGDGHISVLSLGPNPKVLAVNDMQDSTYATPAAVDGVLYVRTHKRLYAFGVTGS